MYETLPPSLCFPSTIDQYRAKNEVLEKENDGQEVKPDTEGVRNVPSQPTEEAPLIRSPANDRSPSGNFIADHVVIGRTGFNVRDECKPKGIKM